MTDPNPEFEQNAPDWSNEPASDDLLAEQLQERGMEMSVGQEPDQPQPATTDVPPPPGTPGTPMPDTSPPEEQPSEEGEAEEGATYEGGPIPQETPSEEQESASPEQQREDQVS